jgi:acyl-CoA synthetase (AMP-forming)/AMP-acid ligase II
VSTSSLPVASSSPSAAAPQGQTISLTTFLKAALRMAPDLPTLVPGVAKLALQRPHKIGSIGLTFERVVARHPDRPALRFEDQSWTYGELNAWANRLAHRLKQAGVRTGDAVGLLMENRAEVLAYTLGIVKLGATVTLLNHHLRGESLAHTLRITGPRIVILGAECEAAAHSLTGDHPPPHPIEWWWDGEGSAPNGWLALRPALSASATTNLPETAQIVLKQAAFHIFTSGTTGMPKASVMSHYRWHRCLYGLGMLGLRLRQNDVLYCALPLYHNNALTVSWSAVVGAGACLALARKFSVSGFWGDIRRHRATAFTYIGELCRYLLNQAPQANDGQHGVRAIIGNGLRPDIWPAFQQRFGIPHIAEFYAASECNLAFVNAMNMPGSAGLCPLSYAIVSFDVAQEQPVRANGGQGFMREVAKGEVGLLITEITDRAPLDGYTDAKATEAKVYRNVFKQGDAWFNTGDLVRDQGFGHIQFIDRVGDTFRWKGENVATTEVEAALCLQPGIQEAVVYGVQIPGADGRAGMAALQLAEGVHTIDGPALMAGLREALPRYAIPLFLRLRDSHEVTATFKHRKVELKREAFDPQQVSDALWVLTPHGYQPLSSEHLQAIQSGQFRFE